MYGDGGAEEVLGEAIAGRRDDVFVVSKVYPHNAGARSAIAACERSLQRLGTDRLDLYLLHWRGRIPLAETVGAFERLRRDGQDRALGRLEFRRRRHGGTARACPTARSALSTRCSITSASAASNCRCCRCAASARLPSWRIRRSARARCCAMQALLRIAGAAGISVAQLALAWLLRREHVISIPQTSDVAHVHENRAATAITLSSATIAAIDAAFPPPVRASRLAVI